ncbi:MAG TPA: Ni/Fe hydrogenase subunit alpha [Phycisphaerae bacterium]|nr:Ni/Fe hydrogenase subunit alpha [Phycisphaerae bacterium]
MSNSRSNRGEVRTIRVEALARVEGEGGLHLEMRDGHCEAVRLTIYEPPRFFESLLRGRDFQEVPDITSRICGICPVAYQMGACQALEKALGVSRQIDAPIRALRNLLYCGEWISSHVLHIFMLHLPDFLGYESVVTMAADQGETVKKALRLKKLGNEIVALVGGRAVHPVGVCVGGFYGAPDAERAKELAVEAKEAVGTMAGLVEFMAEKLTFPKLSADYEFVSLCPADEYPMNQGPIRSNKGLMVEQEEFGNVIEERQVPHSTALHSMMKGRAAYAVGPLARLNLNHEKLHPAARGLLERVCRAINRDLPWNNNYLSILARGIETVHALALAGEMLEGYVVPARTRVVVAPREGIGAHGTEAPRGICWHQYRVKGDGTIASARIIPPTSQNMATIEDDLRELAPSLADVTDEEAALRCEHVIRNYDPCISCSVHFLKFSRSVRT